MNRRSESRHASRSTPPPAPVCQTGEGEAFTSSGSASRPNSWSATESGWIDAAGEQLFALYSPPAPGAVCRGAVLLCNAFGAHAMMLHNQYRALAESLASAGFAVLRFDYPGTGDSSGYPDGHDARLRMSDSIHAAADWLKHRAGVDELSLFGSLLGGTVALEVAVSRRDVTGVAVWGAYTDGRAFLRAARAFETMAGYNPGRVPPSGWEPGDREFLGFLLPAATVESLEGLRPLELPGDLRQAAVVEKNASSGPSEIGERLASLGAAVRVQEPVAVDLGNVLEKVGPVRSEALDFFVDWWRQACPQTPGDARVPGDRPLLAAVELAAPSGESVRERVVRFGPTGELFGILTEGDGAERLSVLMLNGGSNHRVGINRNHTEWARLWAATGVRCLRMDLRGLGESGARAPRDEPQLYDRDSMQDVVDAVSFLKQHGPGHRIVVLGLCAGAFQALHAAGVDERIDRVVMLNPLRFFHDDRRADEPTPGPGISGYAKRAVTRRWRWSDLIDGASWRRGCATLGHGIGTTTADLLRRVVGRRAARSGAVGQMITTLIDRGCSLDMVFSADEVMLEPFERAVRADRRRLDASGRFSMTLVDDANHIFSPLVAQERLTTHLSEIVRREACLATPPGLQGSC